MVFFFRSIVPQLIINPYLIYRVWKSRSIARPLKYALAGIYGLETLVYLFGLIFYKQISVELFIWLNKINGIWVIFQIYMLGFTLFFDLIRYADKKQKVYALKNPQYRKTVKLTLYTVTIISLCSTLYWGFVNQKRVEIKTVDYSFNESQSSSKIPVKTYKMVVASDIHLGYIIDRERLKDYVDRINSLHADWVVIDGDLIDYDLRPLLEQHLDEELRRLKAPMGVYFIPGNHDYKLDIPQRFDWIAGTGLTVLKDSAALIDNRLWLIGRDDRSRKEERIPIDDLIAKADTTQPCVFFAHQPGDIKEAWDHHMPLVICGHTHYGQIFPGNLVARIIYTNPYGLMKKGDYISYTTSGLGLSGFPLRIGSHSEIVIFNIEIY